MTRAFRLSVTACVAATALAVHARPAAQTQATPPAQQSAQPTFRIVEPTADTILTGPVTFRIGMTGGTLQSLVIQVEGAEVCRLESPPFQCTWNAGSSTAPRVVRAIGMTTTGQRLIATVRTKGVQVSDRSDVDSVLVLAHVTDSNGRFVKGLTVDDFRILDEGVVQKINLLDAGEGGAEVLLALDVSGSMGSAIEDLKLVAADFLDRLRPVDKSTLTGFNSAFFVLAGRNADRAAKQRAIAELSASGGTAIYDTLISAADEVSRYPGRRAVVMFTDGDDQSSRSTLESAREALHAQDALLYFVSTASDSELRRALTRLAIETGGTAYFAGRLSGTTEHFREIVQDIAQQYLLSFSPEKAMGDGKFRRITVETKNKNLRIRARAGYFSTKRGGG
jgi:Ca-activated chloride channel homolog